VAALATQTRTLEELQMRRIVAVLGLIALGTSACATIMHGTTQEVGFSSSPTNGTVTVDKVPIGTTPVVAKLKRGNNHVVAINLNGYAPYESTLTKGTSSWVWGNIIFGGFIGLGVDALTGGLYNLTPVQIQAPLVRQDAQSTQGAAVLQAALGVSSTAANPSSPSKSRLEATKPTIGNPASVESSEGLHAQASIGQPVSEEERAAAAQAFEDGKAYLGRHEWVKAEQSFQKAVLHDGSLAKYHAALGNLMMTLHRWVDAEASYSAAVLIDVDNPEYRRLLKEARARR
jgi:hypothetical protein